MCFFKSHIDNIIATWMGNIKGDAKSINFSLNQSIAHDIEAMLIHDDNPK